MSQRDQNTVRTASAARVTADALSEQAKRIVRRPTTRIAKKANAVQLTASATFPLPSAVIARDASLARDWTPADEKDDASNTKDAVQQQATPVAANRLAAANVALAHALVKAVVHKQRKIAACRTAAAKVVSAGCREQPASQATWAVNKAGIVAAPASVRLTMDGAKQRTTNTALNRNFVSWMAIAPLLVVRANQTVVRTAKLLMPVGMPVSVAYMKPNALLRRTPTANMSPTANGSVAAEQPEGNACQTVRTFQTAQKRALAGLNAESA